MNSSATVQKSIISQPRFLHFTLNHYKWVIAGWHDEGYDEFNLRSHERPLSIGGHGVFNEGSVSLWLEGLRAGDEGDVRRLWDRYFERLVRLARAKLPPNARRAFDEEDVALSAFQSFCDRASRGLFAQLEDRDDLWYLLSTITARKVIAAIRYQTRRKRGGGVAHQVLEHDGETLTTPLAPLLSREPTPEATAIFAEEYSRLFACLTQPVLKTIAERKLEGLNSKEIASELGVSTRTVERKIEMIRLLWESGSTE